MKAIFIRGLPGSGKSTMAKGLVLGGHNMDHWEADQYFVTSWGAYRFDPKKIGDAHKWCFDQFRKSLDEGRDVVVSNTFLEQWEIDPYIKKAINSGAEIAVFTRKTKFQNVHGVGYETLQKMKGRMATAGSLRKRYPKVYFRDCY